MALVHPSLLIVTRRTRARTWTKVH